MDPGWPTRAEESSPVALGRGSTPGLARLPGGAQSANCPAGSGPGAASPTTSGSEVADHASGRGAGGGHGLCGDLVRSQTLCQQQTGGGVLGVGATGELQWAGPTTLGTYHQAGE